MRFHDNCEARQKVVGNSMYFVIRMIRYVQNSNRS